MASLSVRNNNPGNIRDGAFAKSQLGYAGPGDKNFAKFMSWEDGLFAMLKLLRNSRYRNLTIEGIISTYAPSSENDTQAYIDQVCAAAKCKPSDRITAPAMLCRVAAAMITHEGWIA